MLRINETGMDDYKVTSLYLRGHDGKDIRVVERFEAQGSSRKSASENAQMVSYQITQSDSVITFDSNITFHEDARFRAQRLDVDVYVPYDQPIVIEEIFGESLITMTCTISGMRTKPIPCGLPKMAGSVWIA